MATNNPGSFIGPVDATRVPRYAEPTTFASLPRLDDVSRADVTILGIPFDSGVSSRPGARFGRGHIRAASTLLRPYNPTAQDSSDERRVGQGGVSTGCSRWSQ